MLAPPKTPTVSQTKFAAGIAAGKTKVDAYKEAYPNAKSTKRTVLRARASKASKGAAVQYELARLVTDPKILEACPNWQNPLSLIEHGIATMVRLSKSPNELAIAMKAAEFLINYGEQRLPVTKQSLVSEQEKIVSNLRGLYAKALAAPPIDLVSSDDSPAENS